MWSLLILPLTTTAIKLTSTLELLLYFHYITTSLLRPLYLTIISQPLTYYHHHNITITTYQWRLPICLAPSRVRCQAELWSCWWMSRVPSLELTSLRKVVRLRKWLRAKRIQVYSSLKKIAILVILRKSRDRLGCSTLQC